MTGCNGCGSALSMEIERRAGNSEREASLGQSRWRIENRRGFGKPAQKLIAARELLQGGDVARVELQGAGQVSRRVLPFSLAPPMKPASLKISGSLGKDWRA